MQTPMPLYPMLLQPVYKDYVWGSDRIAKHYRREGVPTPCAESWEVADRPEGMSLVENGPLKGCSLAELVEMLGENLLGRPGYKHFPLLVKIIDAAELLSVQVHPNEAWSQILHAEPKTEMWYVLEAAKEAYVYAGLKVGIDSNTCMAALGAGQADEVLNRLPVKKGDVIYIPAGTVHAIGPGCLILEVQQNSNTTYRLYDWGRKGADGKPRELHVEKGLSCIDSQAAWSVTRLRPTRERASYKVEKLIQSIYFNLDKMTLHAKTTLESNGSFQLFFSEKGATKVEAGRETILLKEGCTALVPAGRASLALTPQTKTSTLIRICLP